MGLNNQERVSDNRGRRENERSEDDNTWICTACAGIFEGDDVKVLECEYCEKHFCRSCVNVSEEEYKVLSNMPAIHWFCPTCEPKAIKNIRIEKEVKERCSEFLKKMENRVKHLEDEIVKKVTKDQVQEVVKDMLDKHSTQINERDNRRLNIIIHNAPESAAENYQARKDDDKLFFNSLQDELGSDGTVTNIVRLGNREPAKDRPMKVTFDTENSKKSVMKNLRKLSNAEEIYKKLSIVHDMSKEEREANSKLVKEARKLKSEDVSGEWDYKVRGPPWARKVVKMKITK